MRRLNNSKTYKFDFRCPPDIYEAMLQWSRATDRPMTALFLEAAQEYLGRMGEPPPDPMMDKLAAEMEIAKIAERNRRVRKLRSLNDYELTKEEKQQLPQYAEGMDTFDYAPPDMTDEPIDENVEKALKGVKKWSRQTMLQPNNGSKVQRDLS